MHSGILRVRIVNKDILLLHSVLPNRRNLKPHSVEDEPLVAVFAENHPLPVPEHDCPVLAGFAVSQSGVRTVIENHTVGEHFHHGAPVVTRCLGHNLLRKLHVHVQAPCEESPFCSQNKRTRVERRFHSAIRRGFGDCSELRGRGILALRKAVNLVIEKD